MKDTDNKMASQMLILLITIVSIITHAQATTTTTTKRPPKPTDDHVQMKPDVNVSCPADYNQAWDVVADLRMDPKTRLVILSRFFAYFITEDGAGNVVSKVEANRDDVILAYGERKPNALMYEYFKSNPNDRQMYLFSKVQDRNTVSFYVLDVKYMARLYGGRGNGLGGGVPYKFRLKGTEEVSHLFKLPIFATSKTSLVQATAIVDRPIGTGSGRGNGSTKYQYLVVTTDEKDGHIDYHGYDSSFNKKFSYGKMKGNLPDKISFDSILDNGSNLFHVYWGRYLYKETELSSDSVHDIPLSIDDGPIKWHYSPERIGCPPHIHFDAKPDAFTRMRYLDAKGNNGTSTIDTVSLLFKGTNYWRINLRVTEYPCPEMRIKERKSCLGLIPGNANWIQMIGYKIDAAITLVSNQNEDETIGLVVGSEIKLIQNPGRIHLPTEKIVTVSIGQYLPPAWGGRINAAMGVPSHSKGSNVIVLVKGESFITLTAERKSDKWILEPLDGIPKLVFDMFEKVPSSPDAIDYDPVTDTYQFFYDNHYVSIKRSDAKWNPNVSKSKREIQEYEVIEYEDVPAIDEGIVAPDIDEGMTGKWADIVLPPPPYMLDPTAVQNPNSGLKREVKLIQGNLFKEDNAFYGVLFKNITNAPIKTYADFASWRNKFKRSDLDSPKEPDRTKVPKPAPAALPGYKESKGKAWVKWVIIVAVVVVVILILLCIICYCCRKKKEGQEVEGPKSITGGSTSGIGARDADKMSSVKSGIGSKSGAKKSPDSDATLGKSVPAIGIKTPSSAKSVQSGGTGPKYVSPTTAPTSGSPTMQSAPSLGSSSPKKSPSGKHKKNKKSKERSIFKSPVSNSPKSSSPKSTSSKSPSVSKKPSFGTISPPPSKEAKAIVSKIDHRKQPRFVDTKISPKSPASSSPKSSSPKSSSPKSSSPKSSSPKSSSPTKSSPVSSAKGTISNARSLSPALSSRKASITTPSSRGTDHSYPSTGKGSTGGKSKP